MPLAHSTRLERLIGALPAWRLATLPVVALLTITLTVLKVHLSTPILTPDSTLFFRIADNLRLHGCLSDADPAGGQCTSAWGSQPPGYTAFLALVRSVTDDLTTVVALQAVIFSASALWLAFAIPYRHRLELVARVALLLGSPLTLAWGRWVLTETLATSATMAAFAVFARALSKGRINLAVLSGVIAGGMLLRWDQIWLALPAVGVLALLYSTRKALNTAMTFLALVATPYAVLSARAVVNGLQPVPVNTMDLDLPPGIIRFWRVAALDQRATSQLMWPAWSGDFAQVREVEVAALTHRVAGTHFASLLNRLSSTPPRGQIGRDLDGEFDALARQLAETDPVGTRVGVPLTRAVRMWTWPDRLFYSGWSGLPSGRDNAERWRTGYRLLIAVLAGLAILPMFDRNLRRLAALLLLYAAARTCFLVAPPLTMLEARYLTEAFPVMEVVALRVLAGGWKDAAP